jgi:hypothetical protein
VSRRQCQSQGGQNFRKRRHTTEAQHRTQEQGQVHVVCFLSCCAVLNSISCAKSWRKRHGHATRGYGRHARVFQADCTTVSWQDRAFDDNTLSPSLSAASTAQHTPDKKPDESPAIVPTLEDSGKKQMASNKDRRRVLLEMQKLKLELQVAFMIFEGMLPASRWRRCLHHDRYVCTSQRAIAPTGMTKMNGLCRSFQIKLRLLEHASRPKQEGCAQREHPTPNATCGPPHARHCAPTPVGQCTRLLAGGGGSGAAALLLGASGLTTVCGRVGLV